MTGLAPPAARHTLFFLIICRNGVTCSSVFPLTVAKKQQYAYDNPVYGERVIKATYLW